MAKTPKNPLKAETRLINAGRDPASQFGFVNPPVYHASTVLYPTAEDQSRASFALPVWTARHADQRSA